MSRFFQQQLTTALTIIAMLLMVVGVQVISVGAVSPPNIITYQGRVLDANGVPVSGSSLSMKFFLYTASTGGTCVWSNSSGSCDSNTPASTTARSVTLTNGLFTENLGDTTLASPYAAIADSTFADNAGIYLAVEIAGETLSPRKLLTAAPYALNADTLDGIDLSVIQLWEVGTSGSYENDAAVIVGTDAAFSSASGGVGDLKVGDQLEVDGAAFLESTLSVTGNTTMTGTLTVPGSVLRDNGAGQAWHQIRSGYSSLLWLDSGNASLMELTDTGATASLRLYGGATIDGDLAVNGDDITSDGDFTITGATGANIVATTGTIDFTTTAAANMTATLGGATNIFNVLTGNLKVGNGTPSTAQDGEDLYVEGNLEVDGNLDVAGTITGVTVTSGSTSETFNLDSDSVIGPTDVDVILIFEDDTSITSSTLTWDDGLDLFIFNNDLQLTGDLAVNGDDITADGDLVVTGATGANIVATTGTLDLSTTAAANITLTPGNTANLVNVLTGNFQVGNGVPSTALNGEDAYIEGFLEVDGASDFDGDLSVADTNIAFDGATTTFTTTGAFTLTPGGAVLLGDNGDTMQIDSSDWDISTTGAMTGIGAITSDGAISTTSTLNADGASTFAAVTLDANSDLTMLSGSGSLVVNNTISNAADQVIDIAPAFAGGATDALVYTVIDVASFTPTNAAGTDTIEGLAIRALTQGAGGADAARLTANAITIGDGWDLGIAGATYTIDATTALTVGAGAGTIAINSSDWDISTTGAMTGIGAITADGLITGTAGATITGAAVSLNASSNFDVNVATGTSTGDITLGGGTAGQLISINSDDWDISTTGAMTGIGAITADGLITGTGGLTLTGATAIAIGNNLSTVAIDSSDWDISTTGDMTGIGAITSNGAISTTSTLNADGVVTLAAAGVATTIEGTLNVDQAVTFDTTLGVTGDTTLTGDIAINGDDITSDSDLTINPAGGQVLLGDTDVLNIGGVSALAYNSFSNAGGAAGAAAVAADNDVYIQGDLEVDATATFDGTVDFNSTITIGGTLDMENNLITNIGNAGTDFAAGGGLNVAGTLDANGDLQVADTNIAFDGATTTFTTTGAFTLTPGGAVLLGDNGDTMQIDSSDWDISTTGAMTGIGAITADGAISTTSTLNADGASTFAAVTLDANSDLTMLSGSGSLIVNNTITNASDQVIDIVPAFAGGAADTLVYTAIDVAAFTPTNAAGTDTIEGLAIRALTQGVGGADAARLSANAITIGDGWDLGITGATYTIEAATALTVGAGGGTIAINSSDWDISTTGAMTGIGAITADGLIIGTAGATITGAAVSLNASSNFDVNVATGTSTGDITLGGGTAGQLISINSDDWDISTTGAMTGIGAISADGLITGTGGLTLTGATAIAIGNNLSTVAIDSSDWDISTTGAMTGIGAITADGVISTTVDDASNTAVTDILIAGHTSSGVVAAGIGTGLSFTAEDLGGNEQQGSIDVVLTTVTDTAEVSDIIFSVQQAGAISVLATLDGSADALDIAGGLIVSGTTDLNGDLQVADTNIAFDGATTTFTTTGAFTLTPGGAVLLGDSGDTMQIDSSDWDISTTGDMTGIGAITSNGAISTTSTLNADGVVTLAAAGVATTIEGTLNVDQAVTFDTTLGVTGDTTLTGDIAVNGDDITSDADLTINPAGGQVLLADTDVLNIGGVSALAYNAFSNAAGVAGAAAVAADNDVYIQGDLEVDATATFDGAVDFNSTITIGGTLDMENNLITNIGDAGTDFTAGGGLNVAGTLDANGDVLIADTNIAFDGASTTFTTTGTFTLTPGGAVLLGDGGDTMQINSSDWDISTTGDMTGIGAITMDGWISLTVAGNTATLTNTTDAASMQGMIIQSDSATPAANDEVYVSLRLSDSVGTQTEFVRLTSVSTDATDASEDGRLDLAVMTAGALADEVQLDGTSLAPSANDGNALGTTTLGWSDLFLATGGVINWNNGDVSITETNTNLLTLFGGDFDFGNNLLINLGNAGTDFTASGGLTLAGTLTTNGALDANGNVSIADTDIAFDGASTTFTTTGAFTLTPDGAVLLGDGGDTMQIDSSDWDISTTGDMTGIGAITSNGAISTTSTLNADGASTFAAVTLDANSDLTMLSGSGSLVVNNTISNAADQVIDIAPAFAGGLTDALVYTVIDVASFTPTNAAGTDTIEGLAIRALTQGAGGADAARLTANAITIGDGWDLGIAGATYTIDATTALTVGAGAGTIAINSSDWDISTTGAMTGIGAITADGLITGTGGLTLTGATAIAIGNNLSTVAIDSSDWDISTTGAMTGIGAITMDGALSGATSIATTGDLTVSGGDVTGANSDSIDIGDAADATLTLTRNDAGQVVFTGADNDANAAVLISAGGTETLTLGDVATGTNLDSVQIFSADWEISTTGAMTGIGAITSDGAISTTSTLNADGVVTLAAAGVATTIEGTLNVDQAVTFDTTLGVTGNTTLTGDIAINGNNITSTGTLDVNSTGDFSVTLDATESFFVDAYSTASTNTEGALDLNLRSLTADVVGAYIAVTQSDGTAADAELFGERIELTGNDANGELVGLEISSVGTVNATADTYTAMIRLTNAENTAGAVTDALLITTSSGTAGDIVDAIDASADNITNALNAGGNFILMNGTQMFGSGSGVMTFEDTSGNDSLNMRAVASGSPDTVGSTLRIAGRSYQDTATAASGTVALHAFSGFARPTLTASNTSVTTTRAATLYIENSPLASTNQTISLPLSLYVDAGYSQFDDEIFMDQDNNRPSIYIDSDATSATVLDIDSDNSSGNIMEINYNDSQTQAGNIIGLALDLDTNLTGADDQDLTGIDVVMNGLSNSTNVNTFYRVISNSASGAMANSSSSGTLNWRGVDITLPVLNQTGAGSSRADGLRVLVPASGAIIGSVSTATMSGLSIVAPTTSGPALGTLYGIDIGALTSQGAATEIAMSIGTGWDTGIDLNANTLVNIGNAGTDFSSSGGLTLAAALGVSSGNITITDGVASFTDSNVTVGVTDILTLGHSYGAGAGQNDMGSGIVFSIENSANVTAERASIDGVITDVSSTAEVADIVFNVAQAGTVTEIMRLDGSADNVDISGTLEANLVAVGATQYALCHTNNDNTDEPIGDCSGAPTADYAEQYPVAGGISYGDIVVPGTKKVTTTDGHTIVELVKSSGPYQGPVSGIVADNYGDFTSAGYNINESDNPMPVALVGRVPVNVTNENGAIKVGDYLTTSSTPGSAMKATEVGRVIGMALDDFSGASGQVMVQVNNGWYIGDVIASDGTSTVITDKAVMAPLGTASAETPAFDSYGFALRGSAFDGQEAQAVEMMLKAVVDDKDTYRLSVRNTTDSEVAYITNEGTMKIAGDMVITGKLYPSDRGTAQTNKYIYYDGSEGAAGDFMRTNAKGWATGSYDFAEMFPSDETLQPGEVVVFAGDGEKIKRSFEAESSKIAGIVSTRPGFLAGENTAGAHPVALAGRVPTLTSAENGEIKVGDPLTTSSTPGRAMKATKAGMIVGYALEPLVSGERTITTFVSVGYWGGEATSTTPGTDNRASGFATGTSDDYTALNMSGNIYVSGHEILSVGRIAGVSDIWSIELDGTIKTEGLLKVVTRSHTDQKVETIAVTSPQSVITLTGTAKLENGQAEVRFEEFAPEFNDVTAAEAPLRIIVTPNGPVSLYVSEKDNNHFVVKQFAGEQSAVEFDWMVTAYRKGYEPTPVILNEAPVILNEVKDPTLDSSSSRQGGTPQNDNENREDPAPPVSPDTTIVDSLADDEGGTQAEQPSEPLIESTPDVVSTTSGEAISSVQEAVTE